MARGERSERCEAQRPAAVDERDGRRNAVGGGHLARKARDRAVGDGEKHNGSGPGPQRPHQRRHAVLSWGQQHSMTGAPPRTRQAPAQVAPARDD